MGSTKNRSQDSVTKYGTQDPTNKMQQARFRMQEPDEYDEVDARFRDKVCHEIGRWFYDAGIPFNAAAYDSFKAMIEAIGQFGPRPSGVDKSSQSSHRHLVDEDELEEDVGSDDGGDALCGFLVNLVNVHVDDDDDRYADF